MNMSRHQLKSASWGQSIDMETSHSKSSDTQSERSKRLARDLEEFVDRGMKGILATEKGEEGAPSIEAATELQIQIARMFRQVGNGAMFEKYILYEAFQGTSNKLGSTTFSV